MRHNDQIEQRGSCSCSCHSGLPECDCGWRKFFPRLITHLKSGSLESRVKQFSRNKTSYRNRRPMSVTGQHQTHVPTQMRVNV